VFILVGVLAIAAVVTVIEDTGKYIGMSKDELWAISSLCPKS